MSKIPTENPKLQAAMQEIDAICKKYGIAGAVSLASKTHASFKVIFPDWCGVQIQRDGNLRITLKSAQREKAQVTMHVAFCLRDMSGLMFQNFEAITEYLVKNFNIEHHPFSGLSDMDGWQKPDLGAAPHDVIDLKKQN
jgi:hypothetical protein